jgi:hypothetical protein
MNARKTAVNSLEQGGILVAIWHLPPTGQTES